MQLLQSLVPILLVLTTIEPKTEWILNKTWKLWNSDGNLHLGQSQVKNIHFFFIFCHSENKSSVEVLMQCLWIILRHDFWKDFCLFSFGRDIYLSILVRRGLISKPQAKCHLVPLYLKECRHLCSSQLLFPQVKPKQTTWINSTTGNRGNVYFWFEDFERRLFLLSRDPLLHGFFRQI